MTDTVRMQGTCVWFDPKKGYGFIKPDDMDKDLFVQYTHLEMEGFRSLKPNQRVEFEIGQNHRGDIATNVTVI